MTAKLLVLGGRYTNFLLKEGAEVFHVAKARKPRHLLHGAPRLANNTQA